MNWTTKLLMCASLAIPSFAHADPCGMVPPMVLPPTIKSHAEVIRRTGVQTTYVAHSNGIETMVLRPGFSGKTDQFGMLIPFPSPPAIRKTADDTFQHIAAAIDPPRVKVDLNPRIVAEFALSRSSRRVKSVSSVADSSALRYDEVKVINQEAVGMYEVAVLAAGSSVALDKWMVEHQFKYPDGMDEVIDDYIEDTWVFVAVKTRVGQMPGVAPGPGVKSVRHKLPAGSSFNGHVQGMGFRFETDELVVPMRLSTFNGPDTHNLVYVLTDGPVAIDDAPASLTKRQVPGHVVLKHITAPLPLEVIGGTEKDIDPTWLASIYSVRDPTRYNGLAKELIAGDLLAMESGQLILPYEETEKALLNISEELGMRGAGVDGLMDSKVALAKDAAQERSINGLRDLTLTVVDGEVARSRLRDENITFASWVMPSRNNNEEGYNARLNGAGVTPMPPYQYGQRRR